MRKTYFEKDGGLRREVFSENGKLFLSVDAKTEKAEIDFLFEYGPDNEDEVKDLWSLTDLLARSNHGGLKTLLRYSAEPDKEQSRNYVMKDGFVGGVEGNYSSLLEVKEGRLIYAIEMCSVGCYGEAKFDLGLAQRGRVTKISRMIEGFDDYLMTFVYSVKHHYIDNMEVEPWEELLEE